MHGLSSCLGCDFVSFKVILNYMNKSSSPFFIFFFFYRRQQGLGAKPLVETGWSSGSFLCTRGSVKSERYDSESSLNTFLLF